MRRVWWGRGGVLLLLLLIGWSAGSALRERQAREWSPRSGRLRVLTTILPLYDFVREIGGSEVEMLNLLPPGVDPHDFALSPRDVSLVAEADLIIANGGGLDDFMTEALRKAQVSRKPIVEASEGLPMRGSEEEEEAHDGHHHEQGDPHLWLDPQFARRYVRRIADALTQAPSMTADGRAQIRERAARYDAKLLRLDADFRRGLAPLRGRPFIAFHSAFAYLAARYDLEIAAVWQRTPGREPSPREVANLLQLTRTRRIHALFSEPQLSARALERIAADARLPVYALDPFETAPDLHQSRYLTAMRANLATLQRALSQ